MGMLAETGTDADVEIIEQLLKSTSVNVNWKSLVRVSFKVCLLKSFEFSLVSFERRLCVLLLGMVILK